jgi:hypothetical protein
MDIVTRRITVDISREELELLDHIAIYEGRLSRNAAFRHILMEAARKRNLLPFNDGTAISETKQSPTNQV